ncbi:MAG: peptide chain release factor N(5)-glutamine methyltransferase [Acidobacteriaceae bacterium]|nr:peptide chain release factor N(5)-glutamine methyltransferase [Acidobacteriaceae bacterium]
MTVRELLQNAATKIDARDASILLAHTMGGRDRAWMLAHGDDSLDETTQSAFDTLLERRVAGEPLQYLTGVQEFYGLKLHVTPAVLIPRPETELLVEQVELWATQFHDERTLEIADVGTGSGAIAIALATHVAGVNLSAVDISPAAIEVASENALRLGCARKVSFYELDLLTDVEAHRFDAIVSNPPYVPSGDAAEMQQEVVEHEPHTALFAGEDGLEIYRRLIPQARRVLKPHGLLAMEFGYGQKDALAEMLSGWKHVRFIEDYAGIPRHVLAQRP